MIVGPNRRRHGFSLIEAIAATALVGITVVAAMGALSATARTEAHARESEYAQLLALDKYDELIATGETTSSEDGDFTDRNESAYSWHMVVGNTGVENLSTITVTITAAGGTSSTPLAEVDGLIYVPSTTTTTTTTGATSTSTTTGGRG